MNDKKVKKLMTFNKGIESNPLAALSSIFGDLNVNNMIGQPEEVDYIKSLVMLAVALGTEERCQEDINKMYQTNEKTYFHFYNMFEMGKTKIFDKFSIKTSECIKKCYGIILSEEFGKQTNGVPLFIQRLIKKAYKMVYNFNMHKRWNMLEEFIVWYKEKAGGVEKMSGIYLDRCFYVLVYLAYKEKRMLFPTEMFKVVDDHFHYLLTNPTLEDVIEAEENLITGFQELIEKTTYKNQVSPDVSYIFENIRLIEEDGLCVDIGGPENFGQMRSLLATMPLTRITNALIVIMETFGLSGDVLRETKVGNKRLEEIAKYIYILKSKNNLPTREAEILFLVALVIYAMATEYNNLRSDYYEGLKVKIQEQEVEEQKREAVLEDKYKKEIAALREKLRNANETIASMKIVQNNNQSSMKQLEMEQKRLINELNKAKENDKEIQFLREFYFNSQTEHKPIEDIGVESITDYLSSIKGVVVGGHPNLVKKMKEQLPNFDFVLEEETSRNLSFLRNKDIVFFSSVHDNHGLFYKVIKETNNSDTVLTYLEKYQNLDLLLRDMYEKCKEKLEI